MSIPPTTDPPLAAAWYGKLPGTGDFASRRLDPDQLETLDAWLTDTMVALRARDPEGWLNAYLASPSWRFAWMADAAPAPFAGRVWIGVVMPSVDSVGRYFPLVFVCAVEPQPTRASEVEALTNWLERLDDLAAEALDQDWAIDRMEAALSNLGMPVQPAPAPEPAAGPPEETDGFIRRQLQEPPRIADALFGEVGRAWTRQHAASTFWYCRTPQHPATLMEAGPLTTVNLAEALFGSSAG
jgi:type VI secretion system protein ImpM